MKCMNCYPVLERARELTEDPGLTVLTIRRLLGQPMAGEIRQWLLEQQDRTPLCLDYRGVEAVTLSVAEELGPLLMQSVQQASGMAQKYPIFLLTAPEPSYTFAQAFTRFSSSALARINTTEEGLTEGTGVMLPITHDGESMIVVLGEISPQMSEILKLADHKAEQGLETTSEDLMQLDFLSNVSQAARSKRLTELYNRRLLAYRANPMNPKERLFTPVWRLDNYEQHSIARQLFHGRS